MTLTESNGGTRMSSTRYILYGNVTAEVKVQDENGVVVAFILMGDTRDEMDWEYVSYLLNAPLRLFICQFS
jgi:beta-glucanase (GH16 family)